MARRPDSLVPPPGKAAGCLHRHTALGSEFPIFKDRIGVIPQSDWHKYIGIQSIRHFVKDILDQDGVGSCAAEATTQAVMIVRAIAGLPFILLNPWTMYRITGGGADRGSSIDANVRHASTTGVVPMYAWERSNGWRSKPPAAIQALAANYRVTEWFDIGSIEEFGTALIKGFPVVYGRAMHAICAVELAEGGIHYANSWDESWGDNGFGFDRWDYIRNSISAYGAFAARTPVIGEDDVVDFEEVSNDFEEVYDDIEDTAEFEFPELATPQ